MTESLNVDLARLEVAGATLQNLAFPALPPSLAVQGNDAISKAVQEIGPTVEAPVIQRLSGLKTAIANYASNVVRAAHRYADTDRELSEAISPESITIAMKRAAASVSALSKETIARRDLPDAAPTDPADADQQLGQMAAGAGFAMQAAQSVVNGGQQVVGAFTTGLPADTTVLAERQTHLADASSATDHDGRSNDGTLDNAEAGEQIGSRTPTASPDAVAPARQSPNIET